MTRRSSILMYIKLPLSLLSAVAILSGCAWANRNAYKEPTSGDIGQVIFVNHSPQYHLSVNFFKDPAECTGIESPVVFQKFTDKVVKVAHQPQLAFSGFQVISAGVTQNMSCGGTYSMPFSEGDLRITLGNSADRSQCGFRFESSTGGGEWKVVQGVREREATVPFFRDGAHCKPMALRP